MPNNPTFPAQAYALTKLRVESGLTLEEVAKKTYISNTKRMSKTTISVLERGERPLHKPMHFELLAKAYDTTPEDIAQRIAEGGTVGPQPPGPRLDNSLATLTRAIQGVVAAEIDRWAATQQEDETHEKLEEMLRRILRRATTSAPFEFTDTYDKDGYDKYTYDRYTGAPGIDIKGAENIVRIAIELIEDAANNERTPQDHERDEDIIIVTWRGEEDPLRATTDVHLRTQWVGAIRSALAKKWYFHHYIQLVSSGRQKHRKALRSILNFLAFIGPSQRYKPLVLPPDSPWEPDLILVPGQGALVLESPENARYYPYRPALENSVTAFRARYKGARKLQEDCEELFELSDQASVRHLNALSAIEDIGGHRIMLMDGIPQYLVPESVHRERCQQLIALLRELDPKSKYIALVERTLNARLRREATLLEQLSDEKDVKGASKKNRYYHRDFIPVDAITRLVQEGETSRNDAADTLARISATVLKTPFPPLTPAQRLSCLEYLRNRLKLDRYDLILVPSEDADDYGTQTLIRSAGKDYGGILLQFWQRQAGDPAHPRVYKSAYSENPAVVEAFVDNPLLKPYLRQDLPKYGEQVDKVLDEAIATLGGGKSSNDSKAQARRTSDRATVIDLAER